MNEPPGARARVALTGLTIAEVRPSLPPPPLHMPRYLGAAADSILRFTVFTCWMVYGIV